MQIEHIGSLKVGNAQFLLKGGGGVLVNKYIAWAKKKKNQREVLLFQLKIGWRLDVWPESLFVGLPDHIYVFYFYSSSYTESVRK